MPSVSSLRRLLDRDLLTVDDLAADVECDALPLRHTGGNLHRISIVACYHNVAEFDLVVFPDNGNLGFVASEDQSAGRSSACSPAW